MLSPSAERRFYGQCTDDQQCCSAERIKIPLCCNDLRRLVLVVSRAANDCADGASPAWWGTRSVEFGDASIPGAVARRLCLCTLARAICAAQAGDDPYCGVFAGRAHAPHRACGRQSASRRQPVSVGADVVAWFDRATVFRGRRASAVDAALVYVVRRGRSLSALRCVKSWQFWWVDCLSADR